jgi:hypothetical protein
MIYSCFVDMYTIFVFSYQRRKPLLLREHAEYNLSAAGHGNCVPFEVGDFILGLESGDNGIYEYCVHIPHNAANKTILAFSLQ